MANEIQLSVNLNASKGGASASGTVSQVSTMAGDQMIASVQVIGTSSEAVNLGDVTTAGYVFLKNMDATNFVSVSVLATAVAATSFTKLLPGDAALIKAVGAPPTLTAIADTAAVNLYVVCVEL